MLDLNMIRDNTKIKVDDYHKVTHTALQLSSHRLFQMLVVIRCCFSALKLGKCRLLCKCIPIQGNGKILKSIDYVVHALV